MHLDAVIDQVRYNCDLSDARFAGHYSVCGLALRLRDLFKWEQRLAPWDERDASEVLAWIDQREQRWERLQGEDFMALEIDGQTYDPFDTLRINACLSPRGLFYGAGYAQSLKPSFVLGRVDERDRREGLTVIYMGDELARDLLTLPALSQGRDIVLRKEAARLFVWDQIFYVTPSRRPYLAYALDQAGIGGADPSSLRNHFSALLESLYEIFVRHEIGERSDTCFDAESWRAMIAAFPHTPIELLLRAVKDMLADTGPNGPLRSIIEERRGVSLGFYMVFHDGLGRTLFPEMREAFAAFELSSQWNIMTEAVDTIHHKAGSHATRLLRLFKQGRSGGDLDATAAQIHREFLDTGGNGTSTTHR